MSKVIHRLKDSELRAALGKDRVLHDGGGLYFQSTTSGAASFHYRYQMNKRTKKMGSVVLIHRPSEFAAVRDKAAIDIGKLIACENVPVGINPIDHSVGLNSSLDNLARIIEPVD